MSEIKTKITPQQKLIVKNLSTADRLRFDDLFDVEFTSLQDGDIVKYDQANLIFINTKELNDITIGDILFSNNTISSNSTIEINANLNANNINANDLTINSIDATNSTFDSITSTNGNIENLQSNNIVVESLVVQSLVANTSNIDGGTY